MTPEGGGKDEAKSFLLIGKKTARAERSFRASSPTPPLDRWPAVDSLTVRGFPVSGAASSAQLQPRGREVIMGWFHPSRLFGPLCTSFWGAGWILASPQGLCHPLGDTGQATSDGPGACRAFVDLTFILLLNVSITPGMVLVGGGGHGQSHCSGQSTELPGQAPKPSCLFMGVTMVGVLGTMPISCIQAACILVGTSSHCLTTGWFISLFL